MLSTVSQLLDRHPLHLASWATLYMLQLKPTTVVALVGPACQAWAQTLKQHLLSCVLLVGTTEKSSLPWLANKQALQGKTTIYVCQQDACQEPTHSIAEALTQLAQII